MEKCPKTDMNIDNNMIFVKANTLDKIASKVVEMSNSGTGGYRKLGKFVVHVLIEDGILECERQ